MKPKQEQPKPPGQPAPLTINIEESSQCRWWADHFGVTRTELLAAILKVGVDANALRKVLGK